MSAKGTSQPLAPTGPAGAPKQKKPYPFWLGGAAACCAATITHPLDLTKYRLQTATKKQGMIKTVVLSAREEGPKSLFHGLTATWLRQASYSITRFAAYEWAKQQFVIPGEKPTPTSGELALCAAGAGAVAGFTGVPAEVALVRMCSDLNRPKEQRYNYRNAVQALFKIASDEGFGTLFRGLIPNVTRSVFLNVAQMAGYDAFKGMIKALDIVPDGPVLHTAASFCAGTFATTVVTPVDVVKSRIQNAKGAEAKRGIMGTIRDSAKRDGVTVFMRGWTPAWLRLQPQTTLLFIFFEQFKTIIDKQREARGEL